MDINTLKHIRDGIFNVARAICNIQSKVPAVVAPEVAREREKAYLDFANYLLDMCTELNELIEEELKNGTQE